MSQTFTCRHLQMATGCTYTTSLKYIVDCVSNFYLQTSTDGNWMHLHYQSKIQAKKALSKNGKVLGNSIMVGVTQCIDKVCFDRYITKHAIYQIIDYYMICKLTAFKHVMALPRFAPSCSLRERLRTHKVFTKKNPQCFTLIIISSP